MQSNTLTIAWPDPCIIQRVNKQEMTHELQTSYWNEGVADQMTKAADLEMQCLIACKIVPW